MQNSKNSSYSTTGTSSSFWFMEFKKMLSMLNDGKTFEDIEKLNETDNIFWTKTKANSQKIYRRVSERIKALDGDIYAIFFDSDISTQKLINLISIMLTDRLFLEFVYDIIREKILIGTNTLEDKDFRIFFSQKQAVSDKVANWTEETQKRLIRYYKTILTEAGILELFTKNSKVRIQAKTNDKPKTNKEPAQQIKILKPIFTVELENWLKDKEHDVILKAFGRI